MRQESTAVAEERREADDPAPTALTVRCAGCGNVAEMAGWKPGVPCGTCGSTQTVPVPLLVEGHGRSAKTRNAGPIPQDFRFGNVAVWAGYVRPADLAAALKQQTHLAARGRFVPPVAELLVRGGRMTFKQVGRVREAQRLAATDRSESRFGSIAVHNGFLTRPQLSECLAEQSRAFAAGEEPPLVGQIAIEKGYMTERQVYLILRAEKQRGMGVLSRLAGARETGRAITTTFLPALGAAAALRGGRGGTVEVPPAVRAERRRAAVLVLLSLVILFVSIPEQAVHTDGVRFGVACPACQIQKDVDAAEVGECACEKCAQPMLPCVLCAHCRSPIAVPAGFGRAPRCPKCGSNRFTRWRAGMARGPVVKGGVAK
jgi:hypothetical protein